MRRQRDRSCRGKNRSRRRLDAGFVSVWTVALATATWGLVGLVHDGARAVRARSDAFGAAAAAARVGTTAQDEQARAEGIIQLDPERARQRVLEFLQFRELDGTVEVTETDVVVVVEGTTEFTVLPGSSSFRVSASARIMQGTGE